MRKLLVLAVSLSLVFAAGAGARVVGPSEPPPFPSLPGNWSHAEINVKIKRVPHTLILDRGTITRATPTQLRLRESDGNVVTVELARSTIVTFRGFPARGRHAVPRVMRPGLYAETMVIDDGAAVRVLVLRRR